MSFRGSKTLPDHVEQMEGGGMACMHCGGEVDEDGESLASDDTEGSEQAEALDEQEASALFGRSLKEKR